MYIISLNIQNIFNWNYIKFTTEHGGKKIEAATTNKPTSKLFFFPKVAKIAPFDHQITIKKLMWKRNYDLCCDTILTSIESRNTF